jgi:methionyl-tRNA formyltransferase
MRIAVLCNDTLGITAIRQMIQEKLVTAVGSADVSPEINFLLQHLCNNAGVPFQSFSKQQLGPMLSAWLELHHPDVVLVKTFPWKIPSGLLKIPAHGFINFHYAPLPEWRGSNPLFWMLKNRAETGGVTIHRMDENFDSGDILLSQPLPLAGINSFGMLKSHLAFVGLTMMGPLLNGLLQGTLKPVKQNTSNANWYARPQPADLSIQWKTMTASEVQALVRACNPWNKGAVTNYKGWTFGITDCSLLPDKAPEGTIPGTLLALDEMKGMLIACSDGKLLKAEVVYSEEGFFPGFRMKDFGLVAGEILG